MDPAFLHHRPLPLTRPATTTLTSPRRLPNRKAARRTPTSAWEDTLLPDSSPRKPSPQNYHALHLLALSATKPVAYATAQPPGTSRKPYATTSSALPLPFDKSELSIIQDALTQLYSTSFSPCFGRPDLPSELLSVLGLSRAECVHSGNRALGVLQVICGACAELVNVYIEEAPSLGFDIRADLMLRIPAGSICGELVYKQVSVGVSPAFGVAVGNVAGVDVFVERVLFDEACIVVDNMLSVYETPGAVPVVEKTIIEDYEGGNVSQFVVPWEIRANEVDGLTDTVMRASLRKFGIGVTRREDRESLLRKFVKLMDEVERRELGVILAAREGMYGFAAELQEGRSQRGKLLAEMKKAERKGNWAEVVRLGIRMRKLESGIMDITAEPGSYSRDLDRDEWYQPNR